MCVGLQVPVHMQKSEEAIRSLSIGDVAAGILTSPYNDHTASALNQSLQPP